MTREVVRRERAVSSVVATEMTAITRPSLISGTNAALFAPTSAASRELTAGRAADVVDGEARRLVDGARDPRRLALEVDAHVAPPVDVLAVRAGEEAGRLASRPRRRRSSATKPTREERRRSRRGAPARRPRRPTSARARPRSGAGSRARARARERSAPAAGRRGARPQERARGDARPRARRGGPPRSPTRARGRRGRREATRLGSCWAWRLIRSGRRSRASCFQAASGIPAAFKRWAVRPIVRLPEAPVSVPATGRCEPRRRVPGLAAAVSNLGEPAAPTPPSGGLSPFSGGDNAVFTRPELSWPAVW